MPDSNNNIDYMEDLFRKLRPLPPYEQRNSAACQDAFDEKVIEGWYCARQYVLEELSKEKNMGTEGISPSSSDHVHVIIHYRSPMALFIARQVALVAHFPNFKEGDGKKCSPKYCTKITILYNRTILPDILRELKKEEYLCHLPENCKCSFIDGNTGETVKLINQHSYIDIELELVAYENDEFGKDILEKETDNGLRPVVIDDNVLGKISKGTQKIDVRNARRVNMVYNVGADIDNLPPDDPNTAERYGKALLYFCYQQPSEETKGKWDSLCPKKENDTTLAYQISLRNKLSNVFCSDCIPTRIKSVLDKPEDLQTKDEKGLLAIVKDNLQVLAQCEHARWNVEKLIIGFAPLTPEERWEDEQLFTTSRKAYRKSLKNKGHHIDLCSYQDLRRIDPGNMKYDCFLMLAISKILRSY